MAQMPKHPGARARRNKSATAALLTTPEPGDVCIPELVDHPKAPDVDWHPEAVATWDALWSSPMAAEYDESDVHQMYVLLRLIDMFWTVTSPTAMKDLAAEIRLSGQRFGISPLDRRRLEWQIEQSESAKERGSRRRAQQEPAVAPPSGALDPRAVLRSVKYTATPQG